SGARRCSPRSTRGRSTSTSPRSTAIAGSRTCGTRSAGAKEGSRRADMADRRGTDVSWPLAAMSQHVDFLVVTDLAACITYINHAPPGFEVERMIGTPAGDWVAAEHRGRFRDAFDAVVRTGTPQTYESEGFS